MRKRLAILGSTGSIGTQALDVLARHPEAFDIVALSAHTSAEALFEQARVWRPEMLALTGVHTHIQELDGISVYAGEDALDRLAQWPDLDGALVATVGMGALRTVLALIERGVDIYLATKEVLVAGGQLVMDALKKSSSRILPVDSEHSAIFQCLQGSRNAPERLILTASGGPFRQWSQERIQKATLQEALLHPNWSMGRKITIDSASMANKGLELIEARWLFDIPADQIDVVVHPQSIVHSAATFSDGATIAMMSVPDMRTAIAYALFYPERRPCGVQPLSLVDIGTLTFERPDEQKFPCLALAYTALATGGVAMAVYNAANEVAVERFVQGRLPFGGIADCICFALQRVSGQAESLLAVEEADAAARRYAEEYSAV